MSAIRALKILIYLYIKTRATLDVPIVLMNRCNYMTTVSHYIVNTKTPTKPMQTTNSPKHPNYIISTPNRPESPQKVKNSQKVNGAPCIRHPKIAERPYQPPILKNPKIAIFH